MLFLGLKDVKLLIFIISELKDRVDLETEIKSSYSFGIILVATDSKSLEKNLATPLGLAGLSEFNPLKLDYNYSSVSDLISKTCIVPVSEVEINLSLSKLKLRQKI